MKKLVSTVSVMLIIFASFITVFAAGINANEQSVLNQMRTPKIRGVITALQLNKLNNSHFSAVATTWTDLSDTCVTTVSVAVLWTNLVK